MASLALAATISPHCMLCILLVLGLNPFLQSVFEISAFEVHPKCHSYYARDENLESFGPLITDDHLHLS